jgi:hypothetical protein
MSAEQSKGQSYICYMPTQWMVAHDCKQRHKLRGGKIGVVTLEKETRTAAIRGGVATSMCGVSLAAGAWSIPM